MARKTKEENLRYHAAREEEMRIEEEAFRKSIPALFADYVKRAEKADITVTVKLEEIGPKVSFYHLMRDHSLTSIDLTISYTSD